MKKFITLQEYLGIVEPGPATYKECIIDDLTAVGKHHCLITVCLPLPYRIVYQELVPLSTLVEIEVPEKKIS